MKTPLILALATALGLPLAHAQEERRPEAPPPPDAERPPGARPEADRLNPDRPRRPEDERGPERRRPEGERRDLPRPEGERGENPRPEGDRRETARPDAERLRERLRNVMPAPRPQRPLPYLGVVTSPVAPVLAAQLGLAEGFGLVVDEVLPESPAARAGVQRFDVLKLLNDQQLVDPNQLATLVRSMGKDADVSLTVLRKGGEQKLSVKVGERVLPERRALPSGDELMRNLAPMRERAERGARELQDRLQRWQREYGEQFKDYNQRMNDYGTRLHEFQERVEKWRQNPGSAPQPPEPPKAPEPPKLPKFDPAFGPAPADLLREVRPGGAVGVRMENDGNVTIWNTANARVFLKDDEGEVEMRNENGQRTVTARDAQGATVFAGPIDREEERAKLPGAVRRKIEQIDAQARIRVEAPLPPKTPGAIALETPPPTPASEREIQ